MACQAQLRDHGDAGALGSVAEFPPYVAYGHAGSCAEAGGPHFQFDGDGGTTPPNEIHLAFDGDTDGVGFMTVANDGRAGSDTRSVVVHSTVGVAPKLACADLG